MTIRIPLDLAASLNPHWSGTRRHPSHLSLLAWVRTAAERWRQRRALERLDDRMLRDMGISRLAAQEEARKPFWVR
jgi:uncharacterized protein YjiS (DUF1127 family)